MCSSNINIETTIIRIKEPRDHYVFEILSIRYHYIDFPDDKKAKQQQIANEQRHLKQYAELVQFITSVQSNSATECIVAQN